MVVVSREIEIPDVDEIMHPTWAPDGHAICFTGMHHGITDLFVYDLQVNRLRQLTRDVYADLQPSWSPDGRRIAFSTDRFSSNLTTLAFGPYTLASIDPESGAVQQISTTTEGKHINPQWAPDGRSIYFISDRDGIPNIYRTTVGESAETTQVTHVTTGISGITNLSPAMSVASKAGTVAFSVYQDSKYDIRTTSAETQGTPLPPASVTAATLPPLARNASEVASLLAAPEIGLPEPTTYEVEPYKTKLSLQGVSQPVVGVGVSRFGTVVRRGNRADVRRSAWQSPARHRTAGQYRHRRQLQRERHRCAGRLYESVASLELGARRRTDSLSQ